MKNRTIGPLVFALLLLVSSVLACKGLGGSSSPTATYKAFFDAQKRKDLPGMKKTLSKGSLAMLEQGAKEQKKTLDESLKEGFDDPAFKAPTMPPTRNEKVDGDSAHSKSRAKSLRVGKRCTSSKRMANGSSLSIRRWRNSSRRWVNSPIRRPGKTGRPKLVSEITQPFQRLISRRHRG